MINESFEVNEASEFGSQKIWYHDEDPEIFTLELYKDYINAKDTYSHNTLSANTLKPKHFAYYYRQFDRLDRQYGKIFDLKTGRMYPEAKEKFWPDAIDNIGITKPDYVNPRLKPEYWRTEKPGKMGHQGKHRLRMFDWEARDVGNATCTTCS